MGLCENLRDSSPGKTVGRSSTKLHTRIELYDKSTYFKDMPKIVRLLALLAIVEIWFPFSNRLWSVSTCAKVDKSEIDLKSLYSRVKDVRWEVEIGREISFNWFDDAVRDFRAEKFSATQHMESHGRRVLSSSSSWTLLSFRWKPTWTSIALLIRLPLYYI